MQKSSMEINYQIKPFYNYNVPQYRKREVNFSGLGATERIADKFVKRPVASESATGLFGLKKTLAKIKTPIVRAFREYQKDLEHTRDHKIVFAIIEKQLFGKNTTDAITHDIDKMILRGIGCKKGFVSRFHRLISSHHPLPEEQNTPFIRFIRKILGTSKINKRTMLIDNIASSPEFKPEKKLSLRDYFAKSKELQSIEGFEEYLERYNFGEDLDFNKIKAEQKEHSTIVHAISRVLSIII